MISSLRLSSFPPSRLRQARISSSPSFLQPLLAKRAPLSADHVANALEILQSTALSRASALQQYSAEKQNQDSDEETDSPSPIYDSFYFQNGSHNIMTMTNFSSREFENIWRGVEDIVRKKWNVGRGKRYSFTVKDIFFMTLAVLKHAGKWDMLGQIFQTTGPSLERVIMKFVQTLSYEIYVHFVEGQDKKWPMKKVMQQNLTFKTFKYCRYATDVIFQQSFRPSGSLEEAKIYFSGKHKLYGFKTEVSVVQYRVSGKAPQGVQPYSLEKGWLGGRALRYDRHLPGVNPGHHFPTSGRRLRENPKGMGSTVSNGNLWDVKLEGQDEPHSGYRLV